MEKTIKDRINYMLNEVEDQSGGTFKVIYACASGSQAWRFADEKSDFDVRFIYSQPMHQYFSLFTPDDNIQVQCNKHNIDMVGWDIKKTLNLLIKGNPQLFEWLKSPIIYRQSTTSNDRIEAILEHQLYDFYNVKTGIHHYYRMARNDYQKYIIGNTENPNTTVKHKKYLYIIRSLLCASWSHTQFSCPVVDFNELLRTSHYTTNDRYEEKDIDKLISIMIQITKNKDLEAERIAFLDNFIEQEISYFDNMRRMPEKPVRNTELQLRADDIFRQIILSQAGVM